MPLVAVNYLPLQQLPLVQLPPQQPPGHEPETPVAASADNANNDVAIRANAFSFMESFLSCEKGSRARERNLTRAQSQLDTRKL